MKKMLIVVLAVLALVVGMAVPAFAATTAAVTITAQPAYIVVTQAQLMWTLNGVFATGDGVTPKNFIIPSDTYYANPLGDGTPPSATVVAAECYFDLVTTGSSLPLTLTVNCSDFTGGGAAMTNGNGTNGATAYAGYCWGNGTAYAAKVTMKTSASSAMKTSLTPCASYPWGAEILTQTNAWAAAGNSTATMTLTATATP